MRQAKNKRTKTKNEIRYHLVKVKSKAGKILLINHPAFVFMEKDNIYLYVTITHSNKIENLVVIKLSKNPNPNDKKESFWVAEIREDEKKIFGKRHSNWKVAEDDIQSILKFYELYKKEKR